MRRRCEKGRIGPVNKIMLVLAFALLAGAAHAQGSPETICAAVGAEKKLAGAALKAFMKSCRASASNVELICIHPVPLTVKELVDKQKANLISQEVMKLNIQYLMLKYCAATNVQDLITLSSVPLGDGCEMKSGNRLGELVYWTTCNALDASNVVKKNEAPPVDQNVSAGDTNKKTRRKAAATPLQECLDAYVRRHGPFRPEGHSNYDFKSRSDMTSMCRFAISKRNYYWRDLNCRDPQMARLCRKDPMTAGR